MHEMLTAKLDLPQLTPGSHRISAKEHAHLLSDAPRLLACLHRLAGAEERATVGGGPCAPALAPPTVVHVVADPASEEPPAAAYVLSEASNHGGPRYGIVCREGAHLGAERALLAIAALQPETLRFFALPDAAVRSADATLPTHGYARRSHNPCVQYVLEGRLPRAVEARWAEDAERLARQGYTLCRLQLRDAQLVDSLW